MRVSYFGDRTKWGEQGVELGIAHAERNIVHSNLAVHALVEGL